MAAAAIAETTSDSGLEFIREQRTQAFVHLNKGACMSISLKLTRAALTLQDTDKLVDALTEYKRSCVHLTAGIDATCTGWPRCLDRVLTCYGRRECRRGRCHTGGNESDTCTNPTDSQSDRGAACRTRPTSQTC